jgi:hypothetical protein
MTRSSADRRSWLISASIHAAVAAVSLTIILTFLRSAPEDMVVVSLPAADVPRQIRVRDHQPEVRPVDGSRPQAIEPNDYPAPKPEPRDIESAPVQESLLSPLPARSTRTSFVVGQCAVSRHFAGRRDQKIERLKQGGGDERTETAVRLSLSWLARHQNGDGSWSAREHVGQCGKIAGRCDPVTGEEGFNVGLTGLALLAFLGAGYTHLSKDVFDGICYGDVVRSGIRYLEKIQEPSGKISPDVRKWMYNHLLASFALSEAYGLTGSEVLRPAAQRAALYTDDAQNRVRHTSTDIPTGEPRLAWRYSHRCGDNDSSVSGFGAQAIQSAKVAGLHYTSEARAGVLRWYDEVMDDYYRIGYTDKRQGKMVIPGVNEHFDDHPARTAIGNLARIFLQREDDGRIKGGAGVVSTDLPEWDAKGVKVDFYYWYYGSYFLFLFDGPDGSRWRAWNDRLKAAVLERQNLKPDECRYGSWEPVDRWNHDGGRVYVTAMGALILEVYYRYPAALHPYK